MGVPRRLLEDATMGRGKDRPESDVANEWAAPLHRA